MVVITFVQVRTTISLSKYGMDQGDIEVLEMQPSHRMRSEGNPLTIIPLCFDQEKLFDRLSDHKSGEEIAYLSVESIVFDILVARESGMKLQIIVYHDGTESGKAGAKLHCLRLAHMARGLKDSLWNGCIYYDSLAHVTDSSQDDRSR